VCPHLYCDERFGKEPCRRLFRGAYLGAAEPLPPFGFEWSKAAAGYEEHLVRDLGRLAPPWYHVETWRKDRGINTVDPLRHVAAVGGP
jgi:hypothetical protein